MPGMRQLRRRTRRCDRGPGGAARGYAEANRRRRLGIRLVLGRSCYLGHGGVPGCNMQPGAAKRKYSGPFCRSNILLAALPPTVSRGSASLRQGNRLGRFDFDHCVQFALDLVVPRHLLGRYSLLELADVRALKLEAVPLDVELPLEKVLGLFIAERVIVGGEIADQGD